MKRRPRWLFAALALVLVAMAITVGVTRRSRRQAGWLTRWIPRGWFVSAGAEQDDDPAEPDVELPDAESVAWCAEGLSPLPGGGCLAVPSGPPPWPLVVYLHGIFDPAAASEELDRQSRVAQRATSSGFAALALRGHVGQCSAPEYASRVCWPSNERNAEMGPSFVAEWRAPLGWAARRGATGKRYVFGFSNGGYFAGLLAERDWFHAAAFVVARAGPVEPVKATGPRYPMLLTVSDDDPSHDEMQKLDAELSRDEWPHERFVAQGGHALPDGDVEAAVAFFARQERAR